MYRTDGMELRLQSIVIFVSLFLFTLFPEGGHSAVPVSSADSNTGYIHLGPYLEIFEDHEKNFTFSRIISNRNRKLFSQNTIHSPSFGFTGSAFWVKFTLPPDMLHKKNLLLELDYPLMDHADIYVPDSRGEYTEKQYGSLKPFASRDLQHRNIVIKIPDDRTGGAPFYLRFKNEDRMEFPLILWSEKAFRNNLYLEQFILGLYYGIMLVMMLYNLFIFFSVRDVSYLYYVLYILAMGIFQLGQNGFLYQLLAMFRDPPPVHFIPLTQGLLIAGILQFSQSYLNTKEYAKKFHLAMDILKACALVYIALFFVLGYTVSILIGVGITFAVIPVIMGSGITVVLKKYRPSYYFMAAWSVMFVAGFLFLLRVVAVIPHNTLTNYILHIGTTIEVILLSLGLG
ncbi:MAG TPA: 7TM diverse intracellular signaling domain-containing protein, partial [Spirochaetota bacterium]|nr:7TM diverse intracellular signaling domain-containing protein [Spirochaetota bacterium]